MTGYNPFINIDLRLPAAYFDDVKRFCQTRPEGGPRPDPKDSPFPRYVDFWFLAVCVGALESPRLPDQPASGWRSFITGAEGLGSDPWRVEVLELLAIATKEDPAVVGEPGQVVDVANRYAAAGVPQVLDWLQAGQSESVDNLIDSLRRSFAR